MDPDVRDDRLKRLNPHHGSSSDAYWYAGVRIDPQRILQVRLEQKAYLARYARMDVFQWEHREVGELNVYMKAVSEIIKSENESARGENR